MEEKINLLERYFALKQKYPDLIDKIKAGEFDNDPEFQDAIHRIDKSQSEIFLEAIENITIR